MPNSLRETHLFQEENHARVRHFGGPSGQMHQWGNLLRSGSLVFCLNLGGDSMILSGNSRQHLLGGLMGIFRAIEPVRAQTMLTSPAPYDFVVIEVGAAWVSTHFAAGIAGMTRQQADLWTGSGQQFPPSVRLLSGREHSFAAEILSPPVDGIARQYWFRAKLLEFLSLQIFRDDELPFCTSQKASNRERIARTLSKLRNQLERPLDLSRLAEAVGVGPITLSRLISKETGKTLSQHLREMRVERAKDLIRNEGHSVTEAAIEVGYNSLSHFTKAFAQETGQRPSDYAKSE